MTICIAAISELETTNPKIVAVSDGLISSSILQFESGSSKVIPLDNHCYIMIATDNISKSFTVIQRAKSKIKGNNLKINEIIDILSEEFRLSWMNSIEKDVLNVYGLSYQKFLDESKSLSQDFVNHVSYEIKNYEYGFTGNFIIFGIEMEESKPHIFVMDNFGNYSSENFTGFAITGSGWPLAFAEMSKYPYDPRTSLSDTLFRVFNAKNASERSYGVGKSTDVFILDKFETSNGKEYGVVPISQDISEILKEGSVKIESSSFNTYNETIQKLQKHFDDIRKNKEEKQ